jgi:hypothetical protein
MPWSNEMKTPFSYRYFIALSAILLVSGCASPARIDQMVVHGEPAQRVMQTPLRNNTSIHQVVGGQATNPMWKSTVDNQAFEKALETSLQAVGLLGQKTTSQYTISAHLQDLDQPVFGGFNMTVTAKVNYVLIEKATGQALLQRTVAIPYTANFTDSLYGVERLRLANEGAIRVSITELIDQLFRLKIQDVALN